MIDDSMTLAASLRHEFDEHFRHPVALERDDEEELLALRANENRVAVRSLHCRGVLRCPRITRVPSSFPPLLGICGLRGSLVAAYSFANLLGGAVEASPPRWILLCGGDRSVGLVFDELQGFSRVRRREIQPTDDDPLGVCTELVRIGGENRAVVDIPSLVRRIENGSAGPRERM